MDLDEDVGFDDPRPLLAPQERRDLKCPECGTHLRLKTSKYGFFYGCDQWAETGCSGAHGAHPDGSPLGTPANKATKEARRRAHVVFDRLWQPDRISQTQIMTRKRAYLWVRETMNLREEDAHIGHFTIEQCEALIQAVNQEWPPRKTAWERLLEGVLPESKPSIKRP